jgi:hypothetical protein
MKNITSVFLPSISSPMHVRKFRVKEKVSVTLASAEMNVGPEVKMHPSST